MLELKSIFINEHVLLLEWSECDKHGLHYQMQVVQHIKINLEILWQSKYSHWISYTDRLKNGQIVVNMKMFKMYFHRYLQENPKFIFSYTSTIWNCTYQLIDLISYFHIAGAIETGIEIDIECHISSWGTLMDKSIHTPLKRQYINTIF